MNKLKRIKETFTVDPTQGVAALCVGLQKPGYKFISLERKNTKAVVTFEEITNE